MSSSNGAQSVSDSTEREIVGSRSSLLKRSIESADAEGGAIQAEYCRPIGSCPVTGFVSRSLFLRSLGLVLGAGLAFAAAPAAAAAPAGHEAVAVASVPRDVD